MKTHVEHLKEILQENKKDILCLLFVGLPTPITGIVISPYVNYLTCTNFLLQLVVLRRH